jgi:hypothetical protein
MKNSSNPQGQEIRILRARSQILSPRPIKLGLTDVLSHSNDPRVDDLVAVTAFKIGKWRFPLPSAAKDARDLAVDYAREARRP